MKKGPTKKERINNEIQVAEVRVVDEEGNQLGILSTQAALNVADEKGLDLVEVAPMAKPPVCRIMDYGKFQYQKSKKANIAKKKQQVIHVKEVKMRPNTEEHDFQFKLHHAERFLKDGNKAKISIMFRGREMMYAERGKKMLNDFAAKLSEISTIEQMPKLEGRNMIIILAPVPASIAARKKTDEKAEVKTDAKAEVKTDEKAEAKTDEKAEVKKDEKAEVKTDVKTNEK